MITQEQYEDAVRQIIVHCKLLKEQNDYSGHSVRGILNTLGYESDDVQAIIYMIAAGGFDYCLDYTITAEVWDSNKDEMVKSTPCQQVCYWGDPMQIASRLYGLSNCPNAKLYELRG